MPTKLLAHPDSWLEGYPTVDSGIGPEPVTVHTQTHTHTLSLGSNLTEIIKTSRDRICLSDKLCYALHVNKSFPNGAESRQKLGCISFWRGPRLCDAVKQNHGKEVSLCTKNFPRMKILHIDGSTSEFLPVSAANCCKLTTSITVTYTGALLKEKETDRQGCEMATDLAVCFLISIWRWCQVS